MWKWLYAKAICSQYQFAWNTNTNLAGTHTETARSDLAAKAAQTQMIPVGPLFADTTRLPFVAACTHMAESITKVIRVYTQTHTISRGMWFKAPAAVTSWHNNDLQNGEDWMVGLLLFAHKPNWYLKVYLCVTIGMPLKVTHPCNAYRWTSPTLNSSAQKGTVDTHTHTHICT